MMVVDMESTEFRCDKFGVRYESSVGSASRTNVDSNLTEWCLTAEQKCPWCLQHHQRSLLAPSSVPQ